MNFNEYYRDSPGVQTGAIPGARLPTRRNHYYAVLKSIVSTTTFKIAIPLHIAFQFFIENAGFFRTLDFSRCQRICDSKFEFSSNTRDVTMLIWGAFIITALLYLVRLYLAVGGMNSQGETNGRYVTSYANAFVVAVMPVISMYSVLYGNVGGTCQNVFG